MHELRDNERLRVTSVATRALIRIAAAVATLVAVVLLLDALAPAFSRPVKVGIAIGLAIAVSALVESRLTRTPVSAGFILLRAVVSGLIAGLVLYYLQR